MYKSNYETVENLNSASRVLRAVTGAALILFTMSSTATPLGWLAVLPLVAIYPIFTAITGWSPFRSSRQEQSSQLSPAARVTLGAVGAAAIGSVYTVSGSLGSMAVLPLLGVYPVFTAITGYEPFSGLYHSVTESSKPEHGLQVITSDQYQQTEDTYHQQAA